MSEQMKEGNTVVKRDYSNVVLVAIFIAVLFSLGSVKPVPQEDVEENVEVQYESLTMQEKAGLIEDYVLVALEDCGYVIDDVEVEYYPEFQEEEGVISFELLVDKDEIYYGYRMDEETMEILSVDSAHHIPYIPPTEYGEGYLTAEQSVIAVLEYAERELDEVECVEIRDDDSSKENTSYIVSWLDGDYWWFVTIDAQDGRIRSVDQQLVE